MSRAVVENEIECINIDGRLFNFVFRPSSPEAPLLVVLHGHSRSPKPSRLKFSNLNVLCPVDNFGMHGYGSWFLGEGGDFFWINAMRKIIRKVYSGSEIYFIGSSMGGYGSILHGVLNNAIGVYANVPQTRLLGSNYSNQGMHKYFEYVFGSEKSSDYNDLKKIVGPECCTFFDITAIRQDKEAYLQQQGLEFINHLVKINAPFSFEVVNTKGHGLVMPLHEAAIRLLERSRG